MAEKRPARREGEKVWCPDPRNVWQLGTVVEDDGEKLHVLLPDADSEQQFTFEQVHPYDPSHSVNLDNVAEMDNLHEAPLLDLLRRRYLEDKIYTYTGDILISINPYKNIPMLYNFPELDSIGKLDNPDGKCQSILVSGESGAGKTEASKYIMRVRQLLAIRWYLLQLIRWCVLVSGQHFRDWQEDPKGSKSGERRVFGGAVCTTSNPLLEAFGNAKTIRNDNSSRFGKFIKIYYHADGTISGATTSHFLLEKSRIVGSAESERNYHIFYQLCAGLSAEEKTLFKLKPASEFYFLNQGNCIQVPEINDKKDFKELVEAMGTVGIPPELQRTIFRLVACVLHLGNVEFTENAKNESQIAHPEDVTNLAELMMVTPDELEFALTKRTMSAGARGSVAEIALMAVESIKSRNGLAKDIFSKIFDWLVSQSTSRRPTLAAALELALAPSLLQQFNQHVFVYEQEVNAGRRASDENFIQKLHQTHLPKGKVPEGTTIYYSKPRFATDEFVIHHTLVKSRTISKCEYLRKLYPLAQAGAASGGANPRKPIRKMGNKMTGTMTVGRKFRDQMANLMVELKATTPSFVRCVKPNNLRFPQGWNAELILNQLIYLGVMETVRIRRSGFPVRRLFEEFHEKYQILTRNVPKEKRASMTTKTTVNQLRILDNEARKIMHEAAIVIQKHVRGRQQRRKYLDMREKAIRIQAMTPRQFIQRRKYQRLRKLLFSCRATPGQCCPQVCALSPYSSTCRNEDQAQVRRYLARKRFLKQKHAAAKVANARKMHKQRAEFLEMRGAANVIASRYKGYAARNKYREMQKAAIRRKFLREKKMATRIEAFGRMVICRQRYLDERKKIILVQSLWRMHSIRKQYTKRDRQVTLLQSLWRCHAQAKNGSCGAERCAHVLGPSAVYSLPLWSGENPSTYRGYVQRKKYRRTVQRIIKVQSVFRQKRSYKLADVRRRSMARVLAVVRIFLSRVRMRNRTQALFDAANAYDLTEVLHIAQEMPGMLRVRDRDHDMMSLIHVAAKNGDLNLARFVLEENPQLEDLVYGKDTAGSTPLHYASRLAHLDMFRSVSSVSTASMTTPSSRSPSKSVSIGNRSPVGGFDPRMRGMSTASTSSFSMQPAFKPGDHNAPKRNGRRTLVSSKAGNNRRLSSSIGGLPPVLPTTLQIEVYKEGFLRKASGTRWATKRYVMVDEVCLSYYKTEKDKIPLKIVELCDATIKRNSDVDCCFEIRSPRLKSSKNPDGMLSFVADTEQEVHEWMLAIRKVQGVRVTTTSPPNHNMICIDSGLRRDYVNMKNKLGFTPLHLAVQNDEDEGFEAAKVCVWLIENGADPNAIDVNGDTALHYAVELERFDLVETLMKRGADSSIKNLKGLSAVEIAEEDDLKEILNPATHVLKVEENPVEPEESPADGLVPVKKMTPVTPSLLPPPDRLHDSTYVSVFLGAIAVATGPIMETPHFNLYIMDYKGAVVDTAQRTPKSLIQTGGNYWWFGNTWYLQTPLEHLKDGCVAVMELRHRSLVTQEVEVGCWTFFHLDLSKITTAPATFEMYAPPVDPLSKILARIPGDSFLQAEINVSL
ncbi:P-loop containing nucleoside triphosphate hydrolase [Phytophthora cactorum]|nr:P-loop containing nucleoside triphosphate hydrolase [Phytophthora cactorum]